MTGWSWFWIFVGASIGVLAAVVTPIERCRRHGPWREDR